MAGHTQFQIEEVQNWKNQVDQLVEQLDTVLHNIYLIVSEKTDGQDTGNGQVDDIYSAITQVGNTLQDVFNKLIECVKQIVGALVNIIRRMNTAAQNIAEQSSNAQRKLN